MKIIIVGCGKVGTTIAEELYHEGHDITVIDQNAATVQTITENYGAYRKWRCLSGADRGGHSGCGSSDRDYEF